MTLALLGCAVLCAPGAVPLLADDLADFEAALQADAQSSAKPGDSNGISNAVVAGSDPLNLGFTIDFGLFGFSKKDHRAHGGHMANRNGPSIQGVELTAGSAIDPFFRFDLQYQFTHQHFEEMVIETTALPGNLKIRAGQFRTKLGRSNDRCLHQWSFVDHLLSTEYLFSAEGISLPGIEGSWLVPLPWYTELTVGIQGLGQTRSQLSSEINGIGDLIYSPRLSQFFDLTDYTSLLWGLNASFAHSPYPDHMDHHNRSYIYGTDLTLKWQPESDSRFSLTWTTEGWYRELEVPQDLWRDAGGSSELAAQLSLSWQAAVRGEIWRRLSGDTPSNRLQTGLESLRGEASVSYSPSHFSRLRFQYGLEDIEGYRLNHLFALQLEVSAGAHGAHSW